ncbi:MULTISPECIES: NAD-dependent epimerase/dehydratase family protein [unclassified Paenibacillus]|uniref:NAD-dependent epimerase/dehydratase family protein n=1 Tax=unclassified Paenibacillus TaxID=185978 RepID=UPI000AD2208D|nr:MULTISPECIES: NAD-dependent epimerase/dehydratase family protein [unclassified Paenibacillus]
MKKVVVTGGAGFIGSHLVRHLIGLGNQVHVIDDLSTGHIEHVHSEAKLHVLDIRSLDAADLIATIRPSIVVHLAAQADVQRSVLDPAADLDINVNGTLNILKACREAKVGKLVFTSTSGVYGENSRELLVESDPAKPISFYGLSKWAAEQYIALFDRLFDLPYTILRLANVYGPGQTPKGEGGVIAIFMDKLKKGLPLTVNGDGEQTRDFIYVEDIVSAIIAAADCEYRGIAHASTARRTSLNEMIGLLGILHSQPIQVTHRPDKPGDIKHSCLSNSKSARLLQWQPSHSLWQGLEKTYLSAMAPHPNPPGTGAS